MFATRLNKEMRSLICSTLMNRAYIERKQLLEEMEHELGMNVYNDYYSPQIQENMNKLPSEFFQESVCIRVAFNNAFYNLFVKEPLLFSYRHNNLYCQAIYNYPADHELTEKFINFKKLKDEFCNERFRLEKETSAILDKCATVKKLLETWPEVEPILKELNIQTNQSREVRLPAVIHDMNELFRLNGAEGQDVPLHDAA